MNVIKLPSLSVGLLRREGARWNVKWRVRRTPLEGVLAGMFVNTPLHPSQEGNRTGRALKPTSRVIFNREKSRNYPLAPYGRTAQAKPSAPRTSICPVTVKVLRSTTAT